MNQPLPYCNFKFLSEKEINKFNLNSISENSEIGYILEVDLEYCEELHDLHNDYPLCPEKLEITSGMLSNDCGDIAIKYGIKVGAVKKLVPNLGDKAKHRVHYKNFQYYLPLGIKLINIHRILKFRQLDWLKQYTEFNTKKSKKVLMCLIRIFLNY